jgi:hypothetical protein
MAHLETPEAAPRGAASQPDPHGTQGIGVHDDVNERRRAHGRRQAEELREFGFTGLPDTKPCKAGKVLKRLRRLKGSSKRPGHPAYLELGSQSRLVLIELVLDADENGVSFSGVPDLARRTGVHEVTIRRSVLPTLVAAGLIEKVPRWRNDDEGRRTNQGSNLYRLGIELLTGEPPEPDAYDLLNEEPEW